jgi:hypothetical protein
MIKIVGDVNFTDGFFDTGFGIGASIKNGADPFAHIERSPDDIWFGNMECVVSDASNKKGIYNKQFIVSPEDVDHFQHLDFYSVANNHVMQHGDQAFNRMLKSIESYGSAHVGSLVRKSIKFEHQNKKIGVVAFSQREEKYTDSPLYWYMPEFNEVKSELGEISDVDFKIAYVHWGNEFVDRPYVDQKKFGHWLVDIGFDLIVGLHPHVLQGFEIYKGKYIFYSIGNFLFNMPLKSTRYSMILNVDLKTKEPLINYEYVFIGSDNFPITIDKSIVPPNYRFQFLNSRLKIETENELYYKEVNKCVRNHRLSNYKSFSKSIFKFKLSDMYEVILDLIKRRVFK